MASDKKEDDIFPSIPKSKFSDYVEELGRLVNEEFGSYAFQLMILNQLGQEKGSNPAYQVTKATQVKNRWVNVLPNEACRVKLSRINNNPDTDYINASHVKSLLPRVDTVYIATQAPVQESIADFWRMIWEQKCPFIVMLTALIEKGKAKADIYWDESGAEFKAGDFTVKLKNPDNDSEQKALVLRVFEVTRGAETREVAHLQYKNWPDHGVPQSMDEVVKFFQTYRDLRALNDTAPVLIHCSAGIGRTGSFALIDTILEYLEKADKKNPKINVFNTLKHIRSMRPGAVQTVDQYRFCFTFIDHAINKGLFGIEKPS